MKIDRASFLVLTASIAAMSVAAGGCGASDDGGSTGDDQNVTAGKTQSPKKATNADKSTCVDTTKQMTTVSPFEEGFCHSVTEGRLPSDDASKVNTRCTVLKLALKSAIAIKAQDCMINLRDKGSNGVPFVKAINACGVAALKTSCLNPTTEGACKEMLKNSDAEPDDMDVGECKSMIGGLNADYQDQVQVCVAHFKASPSPTLSEMAFSDMFTSCVEGLVVAN